MKLQLVSEWRDAWRMYSIRLALAILVWSLLPRAAQEWLMGQLDASHVSAALAVLLIIARVIRQPDIKRDIPTVRDDRGERPDY